MRKMKKEREFKPCGVLALSNLGGIAIELSDCGEWARYKWFDEAPSKRIRIRYTAAKGIPYVRIGNRHYRLDKFMRI